MHQTIRILVFVLCLFQSALFAEGKVVYLISPPRSGSVAFLRMMQARNDFTIFHEPTQWVYDSKYYHDLTKDWFRSDAPQTYSEVKAQILQAALSANVFVKEMSFAVRDSLLEDDELFVNPNVHFVFLLRNPHHSTISFYKKFGGIFDGFSAVVGYEAAYELFKKAKSKAVNPPQLLLSEELVQGPEKILCELFAKLELPFIAESLSWQDLGNEFTGHQEWHEIKNTNDAQHWHNEAIHSTGFSTLTDYKLDRDGKPTFEEIENLEHREACRKAYEENRLFYERLLKESGN